ncbi:phage Gp37/Gp68 family protein [Roseinatronobacter sp.]
MAENSNIEWTDHTFNPWIGCTKVSPGCDHCYAETWDARGLQQQESRWGPHASRTRTSPANWRKPLAWNRAAEKAGKRARVFCASLADVFDNHGSITSGWRGDLWHLIARTPHLDWLLLTKRPQNIAKMLPDGYGAPAWGNGWPNVWLGTTAENQTEADRRIPHLLAVPAAVRFVSAEPLLGPVRLDTVNLDERTWYDALDGAEYYDENLSGNVVPISGPGERSRLHWVICGGESGPGARPMHPDWARSLRDQCEAAGVAFFFKQWGEWHSGAGWDDNLDGYPFGCFDDAGRWVHPVDQEWASAGRQIMFKVGKKFAGRSLDGREWSQMPGAM